MKYFYHWNVPVKWGYVIQKAKVKNTKTESTLPWTFITTMFDIWGSSPSSVLSQKPHTLGQYIVKEALGSVQTLLSEVSHETQSKPQCG